MVTLIFILALAMHGVGHVLFAANSWGYWQAAGAHSSLVGGLGTTADGMLGVLWLVPLVGFLVGTWGLIGHQASAPMVLVASAVISSVMIILWWGDLVTGSAFFALVFNLLVIAVMLWRPEVVGAARA